MWIVCLYTGQPVSWHPHFRMQDLAGAQFSTRMTLLKPANALRLVKKCQILLAGVICQCIVLYHKINKQTTHTQPFNGLWSGTTWVGRYQKKHSPTHTHPDHRTSFIIFLHLQRSMACSLFILRAWQCWLNRQTKYKPWRQSLLSLCHSQFRSSILSKL